MWKKINPIISYYEKPVLGKIKAEKRYMALAIDKDSSKSYLGLAREITRSKGSVDVPGFVDESKLIIVQSKNLLSWTKKKDLKIINIDKILKNPSQNDKYFIGLEDPDIWRDENGITHVYFTIAFKYKNKIGFEVYLGHAQGKNLDNLTATAPVLSPVLNKNIRGFKEVAISPEVYSKSRINLTEAQFVNENNEDFSRIAVVEARDMSKPWNFKSFIDLDKIQYPWCIGETSPCVFLPEDFVSLNNRLLVGIINGREKKQVVDGQKVFGKFRPGLILFNPETGEIPRVSPEPLFEDPDARTITFASDFVQTNSDEGILYAHVNDSFVRAYRLDGRELQRYLNKNCKI